jgi:hypothetical protein
MNKFAKNFVFKTVMGLLTLSVITVPAFGLVYGNNSDFIFDKPGYSNSHSNGYGMRSTIAGDVIDGAAYFFSGYSDTLLLLNRIELSEKQELDYAELDKILDSALGNMELMKKSYLSLNLKTEYLPYNPMMIQKLKDFNYLEFQQVNGLNPIIFDKVKDYLTAGDMRGVYSRILADIEGIISLLYLIKEKVHAGVFPGASHLWRLNQSCSDTLLFGQYVAMVCGYITGRV